MSGPTRGLGLALGGGAVLILLGWGLGELIAGPLDGTVGDFDVSAVREVASWRSTGLTEIMRTATFFGSSAWLAGSLVLVTVAALLVTRRIPWAAFGAGCIAGALLSTTVKALVDRPRPALDPLIDLGLQAFPSGHATNAAISFGAIGFFLVRGLHLSRAPASAAVVFCVAVVGFTRVYLGVHWPTDVIGGWLLGAAWVAVVAAAVGLGARAAPRTRGG